MSPRKKKGPRPFEPHAISRSDDANAFIPDPGDQPARVDDELAETLGEGFVAAATTGQDQDEDLLDAPFPEEIGGPFVETTAEEELADDTDGNNPSDATREPLPRAMAGIVAYPEVEEPTTEEAQDAAADPDDDDRDPDDPRILPHEPDPARDIADLGDKIRRGRPPA